LLSLLDRADSITSPCTTIFFEEFSLVNLVGEFRDEVELCASSLSAGTPSSLLVYPETYTETNEN
jgi:hypothetical protein